MKIVASSSEADESEPIALSAEQARALRLKNPSLSPWWVVLAQMIVGLVFALLSWAWTGRANAGWSALYGALAVVVPAVLFARGLMSQFSSISAVTAGFGFFVWEAVKIAVSVAMLVAAPRLVSELDWLVLLIALIVTLKVYWLALLWRPKSRNV
ncbi:MAG: ATP synthase subunit I [Burkholderiaceae bacterium]